MLSYLFPGINRQVEHENGQVFQAHARDYEVDGVEQGFPSQRYVEVDV